MKFTSFTSGLSRIGLACAMLLSAQFAHAQFISTASSTFSGASAASVDLANNTIGTISGTDWFVFAGANRNPDYVVAATNPFSATSGNYLQLASGTSAAIHLSPNSFTAISGAYGYTFSLDRSGSGGANRGVGTWQIVDGTGLTQTQIVAATSTIGPPTTVGGNNTAVGGSFAAVTANNVWTQFTTTVTFAGTASTHYDNLYLVVTAGGGGADVMRIDNVMAVPEPESLALFGAGLGALAFMSRRRRVNQS